MNFDGVWITALYPGHCVRCTGAWHESDQFVFLFATRTKLCSDCALAAGLTLAEDDIGGEPWNVCQKYVMPTAEKIARKAEKKALKRGKRLKLRELRRLR